MTLLAPLNARFEQGGECPPAEIWDEWLWGCDLAEPIVVDCLLNRSHLLGLLIARVRAMREPGLMDVTVCLPNMIHYNAKVSEISPRQLKDVIEDLQMHWFRYADEDCADVLTALVDGFMTRLGFFLLHPTVYDDKDMAELRHKGRMNTAFMRRLISTLCVLFRHLDMMHRWIPPPEEGFKPEEIQDFHVQSSLDSFQNHIMHSDLPPATRLLYRQSFSGFYNDVSQVVFLHFPEYVRPQQLELEAIRTGEHAINTLAPVWEMYPDINVCYEDEQLKDGAWNWVIMGKRVYLVDPTRTNVFYSPNIFRTLAAYRP